MDEIRALVEGATRVYVGWPSETDQDTTWHNGEVRADVDNVVRHVEENIRAYGKASVEVLAPAYAIKYYHRHYKTGEIIECLGDRCWC